MSEPLTIAGPATIAESGTTAEPVTIIEALPSTLWGRVKAAWRYRRYYPVLVREISLRKFRNTFLGFWWLIVRPLIPALMTIATFTYVVQVNTNGVPYSIFFLPGFIIWNLFQSFISFQVRTLLWMRGLLKKMYLPKLLIPLASVGPPLIELCITLGVFAVVVIAYLIHGHAYIEWSWKLLLVVPCLLLTMMLAISIGMVTSVLALFLRDIVYSIAYILQVGFFVTPVAYPITAIPENVRWILFALNPMTTLVETTRWAVTGVGAFDPVWFTVGCVEILVIAALCLTFFTRAESYLADTV